MQAPDCITLDFETYPILNRPHYPPKPVGVAIAWPGKAPEYFTGPVDIHHAVFRAFDSGLPILCHNAKFDLAVATEVLGLVPLPWQRIHDTQFLLFLDNPYAQTLQLKPAAEHYLGLPPEERNSLHEWIWEHRTQLGAQYPQFGAVAKKNLGAWIFAAPVELVAPYVCGDVNRTRLLFEHLWPKIQAAGMGVAYDRERKLLPILLENERIGIRTDLEGLRRDIPMYEMALANAEFALRARLDVPDTFNFDSDEELAEALERAGVVTQFARTKTGKRSVSKETMKPEMFTEPRVASALGYRNRLVTCLKMFMKPWLEQGQQRNGYVSTSWNQVRNPEGGTRTGRPSTTNPNFLNISKDFDGRSDGYVHPDFLDVPRLPLVRKYMLPDEGHVWLKRDQSSQEVRTFAHFECGALAQAYRDNPQLDPHTWLKDEIKVATGADLERTRVKNVTFSRLYGGGLGAVMRQARCANEAEARQIMAYHDKALPGRRLLDDEIKRLVRIGKPIRTWGGRLYYCRPASVEGYKVKTYDYQLINYLCQGSAADLTKENIIEFERQGTPARWLLQVYDELNVSAPEREARAVMAVLKDVMEMSLLDVPLLTDGKWGPTWGDLEKYKDD